MSLLTYSGITTKVRAMQSHLLSEEQFHEMAGLEDVRSAADYLKQLPTYAEIFAGVDDSNLHRGHIEQLLTLSEYRDFAKLYRFSNLPQRRFLDLYFMHYEINIIKRILRHVMGHQETVLDLSMFQEFFDRHSNIDLPALAQSENLEDFLSRLKGSPYYEFLSELASKETCTMFDLEMNLDLFYFRTQWKVKNKMLSREERHALEQCFGCRLDLLNIQWIYRACHYYHLLPSDIYALLIPVNYKLKPDQIRHLANPQTTRNSSPSCARRSTGNSRKARSPENRILRRSTIRSVTRSTQMRGADIPTPSRFSTPISILRNWNFKKSSPRSRASVTGLTPARLSRW